MTFLQGEYTSLGHGRSKKEAKNAAAKNLLTQLDLSKLPQKPQRQPHHDNKRKMLETEQSEGGPTHFGKRRRGGGGGRGGGRMGGGHPLGLGGFMSPDMMMGPGPGMGFPGMYGGYGGRMMPPQRTLEDKLVLEKHQSICPDESDLEKILAVVNRVERSLKNISDKFVKEADTASTEREVTGVARVGDLAKSLVLKGDRKVELVVMCTQRPVRALLQSLTSSLTSELSEPEPESVERSDEYEVRIEEAASGLTVTSPSCSVGITLTSPVLRSDPDQAETGGQDLLSYEAGLTGLAELRRAKWFSAMAAPLPGCVETIRVMKDKARREAVWALLGDWALHLLVERALYSAGYSLSPSKSVLRVMEVVSSGIMLPDGPGLLDPCEREEVDVLEHLSPQQREDVTSAAQTEIRNIHYRKINRTLGMEDRGRREEEKEQEKEKEEDRVASNQQTLIP